MGNYQAFFRTVVFRFFFAYGPGQEGMVVPTLLEKVRKGDQISIAGRPGNGSTPSTSPTSSRILPKALELEQSDMLNVAGDEIVSVRELVSVIEGADRKSRRMSGTSTRNTRAISSATTPG